MTPKPPPPIDWPALDRAASTVQKRAHAPYSGYRVGAAVQVASGRIFVGCNVENASYGLSMCAERVALAQMVAAGQRTPIALTVLTPGPIVGTPCGMCRQTLAEFATDLPIRLFVEDPAIPGRLTTLSALLPDAFQSDALDAAPPSRKGARREG